VQRATAQSITGIFRDFGVAEAPPGFQAGWSGRVYFFSRRYQTMKVLLFFRINRQSSKRPSARSDSIYTVMVGHNSDFDIGLLCPR
jgi:hypothetical protein